MKDNVFYYSHIKKCGGIFLILLFIFSVTEDGVQDVQGTSALRRLERSGDLKLWVQGLFCNKDKDLSIKPKSLLSLLQKMGCKTSGGRLLCTDRSEAETLNSGFKVFSAIRIRTLA